MTDSEDRAGSPMVMGRILLFAFVTLVIATLLSTVISDLLAPAVYRNGEVAQYTIRAPREILLENSIETEKRRSEAVASVRQVFSLDDRPLDSIALQVQPLFSSLPELIGEVEDFRSGKPDDSPRVRFEQKHGINFVGAEWSVLKDKENWPSLQQAVVEIVQPLLNKGIIANKLILEEGLAGGRKGTLRRLVSRKEQELSSANDLYSLSEAHTIIKTSRPHSVVEKGETFSSVVEKISLRVVSPNVTYDTEETEKRILSARNAVQPTYSVVRRGEVVVRAGDIISPSQEWRLQQLSKEFGRKDFASSFAGFVLLTSLILLTSYTFLHYFWPDNRLHTKDLVLVSGVLFGSLILIKSISVLAATLGESFSYLDSDTYLLVTPVAAGGILLQATVGAAGVFLYMMSFALLTGLFLKNSWIILLLIIAGNSVGAIALRKCSRRSSFIAAGARVALINMFVVVCFLLINGDFSLTENAGRLFWALLGGIFSGVLGGGLTPIAEYFGRYITDIKLLELASLDRPLLRELSVQAPGTWNHSMVIGQMAEAAAEAIGANGLLARVGAYYHDIGKMKKPAYFVENQIGENRHDKLTPSMSALIIKSHVKDGIELAKEHRLPSPVVAFISEHHGTSLISYFYTKAMKEAGKDESVDASHYCYLGPKPQSKEAGILMLADQVEASSRTLSEPTPARIQGLVQKIMNRVFSSGELDECDLTLRDLHLIAKTFTRVLTGIYHRRIEYSEPAEKIREAKNSSTRESANVRLADTVEVVKAEGISSKEFSSESKVYAGKNSDSSDIEQAINQGDPESLGPLNGEETLKRLGML